MNSGPSIAVAGLGYWGPNLARNFSQLNTCRLGALCDPDPERLARIRSQHPLTPRFDSFETMLDEAEIDAVAIATPLRHHHQLARAALMAGKHVLVEKPFAGSTVECDELVLLARERGLTLMVGHTYLYSAAVDMIRDIVGSGDLGDIRYINSQRLNLGLFQQDINVAWDLAPHDISIILHLLGKLPASVNCQGNAHITPGIEDVTNLSMSFADGQFATIQSSWIEPRKVRQMTIVGTRKMIVYNDIEPREKIRIYDTRVERPPHYDNFGEFQYSYHYGDSFLPHIAQSEPLRQMCGHFIECVTTGADPLSDGPGGRDVVRILEASSESLRNGGGAVLLPASVAVPLPAGALRAG